jgi:hypothetical protein
MVSLYEPLSLISSEFDNLKRKMSAWFKVLTTVNMKVFRDVMPCSLVARYQHFGGTCCLHF